MTRATRSSRAWSPTTRASSPRARSASPATTRSSSPRFANMDAAKQAYEALVGRRDAGRLDIDGVLVANADAEGKINIVKMTDHHTRTGLPRSAPSRAWSWASSSRPRSSPRRSSSVPVAPRSGSSSNLNAEQRRARDLASRADPGSSGIIAVVKLAQVEDVKKQLPRGRREVKAAPGQRRSGSGRQGAPPRPRGQRPAPEPTRWEGRGVGRSSRRPAAQHSTTLRASPPSRRLLVLGRHVGARLAHRLDRGVERDVVLTRRRASAIRAALIALTRPIALRSMHGICTSPPTGSQVSPRWCSIPISAAFSTCAGRPAEHRRQRPRRPSSTRRRPRPGSPPRRRRSTHSPCTAIADRGRGEQEVDRRRASVAPRRRTRS